jgi:hypothetical protein
VVGVRADRGHHHPGPGGGPQLGQAGGELAVAAGAQLDAGEPGPPGEVELGLQAVARQELLLARQLHAR